MYKTKNPPRCGGGLAIIYLVLNVTTTPMHKGNNDNNNKCCESVDDIYVSVHSDVLRIYARHLYKQRTIYDFNDSNE